MQDQKLKVSHKPIIKLSALVGNMIFNLPREMANDIDLVTGKRCITVGINGKNTNILVGEPVPIPYDVFCVLKDAGILNSYKKFTEGEDFKPL